MLRSIKNVYVDLWSAGTLMYCSRHLIIDTKNKGKRKVSVCLSERVSICMLHA